jgi:hypothetical protein
MPCAMVSLPAPAARRMLRCQPRPVMAAAQLPRHGRKAKRWEGRSGEGLQPPSKKGNKDEIVFTEVD